MPARQPFTTLCQALARPRLAARADLHVHTTCSDGAYTSGQVVELARRSGLAALSITDHDSVDGIDAARRAAATELEVISGIELTARFHDQVFHLLGYFFRPDEPALHAALARLRTQRASRFQEMVRRLRTCGVALEDEDLCSPAEVDTLGRRHLAEMLVKAGRAATVREAFLRYLGDRGRVAVPVVGLPVAEAIALVRGAGGVTAWAHPSAECSRERLIELRALGLDAVEAEYPGFRRPRVRALRALAASLGLAITGGSDCHGPGNYRRAIGASGISTPELDALRQRAGGAEFRGSSLALRVGSLLEDACTGGILHATHSSSFQGAKPMPMTIEATFENGVLKPNEPLSLIEGTAVQVTIVPLEDASDPLDAVIGIGDGPTDGADNHDKYIYGKIQP